jgi:hypothetical protein
VGEAGQNAGGGGAEGEPPLVDITGRWGMFVFEDPVAVDVVQSGNTLSGLGCDAGLPDPAVGGGESCAPLKGTIEADRASFGFDIPGYSFRAKVIVSRDASRMAGEFDDVTGRPFKSSWLRLSEDERGLSGRSSQSPPVAPLRGSYELRLIESSSPGTSFDPLRTYVLDYLPDWGIHGDLGVFYYTEIFGEQETAGPILVGPVPATDPVLPVSIRLDRDGPAFTHAAVVDAHGVVSEFELTRAAR